jgi:hypothetical protein
MKSLLKFAMGTALAGVLVNMLIKKRRATATDGTLGGRSDAAHEFLPGIEEVTLETVDEVKPADAQTQDPQPEGWRGAQNVLG